MGSFEFNIPKELLEQLEKMEAVDEIAPKMLEAAAPIVKDNLVKQIKSSGHVDTGELIDSIRCNKPGKTKEIWRITITPTGYAKEKTMKKGKLPNAAKLVFIEYGTTKQQARPILKKVKRASETDVFDKMQEIYNSEVKP